MFLSYDKMPSKNRIAIGDYNVCCVIKNIKKHHIHALAYEKRYLNNEMCLYVHFHARNHCLFSRGGGCLRHIIFNFIIKI